MGRSVVIASHVLHEVEALTQSFLLISGGRLLASGTAEEVHELLFNVPLEMHIRCNDVRRLAAMLLQDKLADSARIGHTDAGDEELVLQTTKTGQLTSFLPQWIRDEGLQIFEMRTADDSLQSLFNSLMKIHRGEL